MPAHLSLKYERNVLEDIKWTSPSHLSKVESKAYAPEGILSLHKIFNTFYFKSYLNNENDISISDHAKGGWIIW